MHIRQRDPDTVWLSVTLGNPWSNGLWTVCYFFFSDTLVQASQKPDDFLGFSALQLLKKPNSAAVLRVVSWPFPRQFNSFWKKHNVQMLVERSWTSHEKWKYETMRTIWVLDVWWGNPACQVISCVKLPWNSIRSLWWLWFSSAISFCLCAYLSRSFLFTTFWICRVTGRNRGRDEERNKERSVCAWRVLWMKNQNLFDKVIQQTQN